MYWFINLVASELKLVVGTCPVGKATQKGVPAAADPIANGKGFGPNDPV
jgi:hypothetical protein